MGGSKTVNDYYITRLPGWEEKVVDPIDKKTMDLVFKKIAKGADSLWFGTIQQFGTDTLSRSTMLWKAGRAWFRLKRTSATSSRKKVRTIA